LQQPKKGSGVYRQAKIAFGDLVILDLVIDLGIVDLVIW
jgi:hypothetical protein